LTKKNGDFSPFSGIFIYYLRMCYEMEKLLEISNLGTLMEEVVLQLCPEPKGVDIWRIQV